jgi:hypothetical protein
MVALLKVAAPQLRDFNPQNLASKNTAWALAVLDHADDTFVAAVLHQASGMVLDFNAQALTQLFMCVLWLGDQRSDVVVCAQLAEACKRWCKRWCHLTLYPLESISDMFCRRRRIAPLLFQDYAWQATGWCYCSSHFWLADFKSSGSSRGTMTRRGLCWKADVTVTVTVDEAHAPECDAGRGSVRTPIGSTVS